MDSMSRNDSQQELLLRHLDGRLTQDERLRVAELLRTNPDARAFLREVAEHAVMVADLERVAMGRQEELHIRPLHPVYQRCKILPSKLRSWQWGLAAVIAIMISLQAVVAFHLLSSTQQGIVRVSKVTGSSQYFGSKGTAEKALTIGASVGAGDTLETRSCDAWVELKLRGGATITIAGHSTLRILNAESGKENFKLLEGSLWGNPAPGQAAEAVLIQTPTVAAEMRGAQFDLQTSPTETILRVNEGTARVRQYLDDRTVDVSKGRQVAASLSRKEPLSVTPQPGPINSWVSDLWLIPQVILGKWLPPTGNERARLGADPLLWPISNRESVMLYAVALAAWKSTERPVLLHSDSKLRFRGRTERAQTVRFGFSAQKMRSVFAGKFELDVSPASLGPAGKTWEVDLPLRDFRPLHPQLASSPDALELTDVYALTIKDDAGLEINHIELLPREEAKPLEKR
jgi:ferric-dicitrate binding protein FerR (iron transport regulator)